MNVFGFDQLQIRASSYKHLLSLRKTFHNLLIVNVKRNEASDSLRHESTFYRSFRLVIISICRYTTTPETARRNLLCGEFPKVRRFASTIGLMIEKSQ